MALSDQKLPLSKESAWVFLAFSHLVGLCHPFPLTYSLIQIIIAHENEENAAAQFEFLGQAPQGACSPDQQGQKMQKEGNPFHQDKYDT